MNKISKLLIVCMSIAVLAALGCGGESAKAVKPINTGKAVEVAQKTGTELKLTVPVKLKTNGKIYEAAFYDYEPTQSLLKQLPLTVSLNRGSRDFCGGNLNINYKQADLVDRYEIGDLTYWVPGKNFVIFTNGDGRVAGKDLVPLGKIKAPVEEILKQGESLEVVIEK